MLVGKKLKLLQGNLAVKGHWPMFAVKAAVIPAASLHCVLPAVQIAAVAQTRLTAPAGLSLTPGFKRPFCYPKAAS